MHSDLIRWTDCLGENEDAFFEALESLKTASYNEELGGYLYFETALFDILTSLVARFDPTVSAKEQGQIVELWMAHLLGEQYLPKQHKPIIGRLADKPLRKQKAQIKNAVDIRKTSRIIFINKL